MHFIFFFFAVLKANAFYQSTDQYVEDRTNKSDDLSVDTDELMENPSIDDIIDNVLGDWDGSVDGFRRQTPEASSLDIIFDSDGMEDSQMGSEDTVASNEKENIGILPPQTPEVIADAAQALVEMKFLSNEGGDTRKRLPFLENYMESVKRMRLTPRIPEALHQH